MDDSPIIDEPAAEVTPVDTDAPATPELGLESPATGKESWREGSGCGSRVSLYGCIIAVALLIAALMAGTSMMRRTVWLNMDRGRRAVVQALPGDLPPAERARTTRNLEHFRAVLEASKDPYPMMGEFMKMVRSAFSDDRLEPDEIEEFNLYLERVVEESGIPVMQLGLRIRNSEFGIRNDGHPSQEFERLNVPQARTQAFLDRGSAGGNSERASPVGSGFASPGSETSWWRALKCRTLGHG
jgi:hypothetical protein